MRKSKLGIFAGLFAVTLGLAACSGGAGDVSDNDNIVESSESKVLNYSHIAPPGSLDPTADLTHLVHILAHDGLMKVTPEGEIIPGLAESWGFTDDENKVFQLKLREDAMFSDGTQVNADAVVQWFERVASAGGTYVGLMGAIVDITADDEYTVTLTLEDSNPDVALILSAGLSNWGSIVSPTALAEGEEQLANATFGAGPYVLDASRTTTGDTYTYVPNEYYYAPDGLEWDEIVVRIMDNPATRLQALQSGQVLAASGHYSTIAAAQELDNVNIQLMQAAAQSFIIADAMGESVPALGDERVRQAMSYAIDREGIANAVYGEDAAVAVQEIPSLDAYDSSVQHYEYDPDEARALLAEAGYADGFTFTLVTQDFVGPDFVSVSQAVIQNWEDIGLTVDILPSTTLPDYLANFQSGAHVLHGSPQFDRTALMNYRLAMRPGGFFHPGSWVDDELEALYAEALLTEDNQSLLREIVEGIAEKAYVLPVVAPNGGTYADASIGNTEYFATYPYLAEWTTN